MGKNGSRVSSNNSIKQMKIVFLTHNIKHHNGGGVFSRALIDGLSSRPEVKVSVCVSVSSGFLGEHILRLGFLGFFANIITIRKIIRDADIIHAIDVFPYGILAVCASYGLKKPIVITAVGSGSILPLYAWHLKLFAVYALHYASALTAISDFVKREILKKVPGLAIDVIYPGISEAWMSAVPKVSSRLQKYKPYILTVGSLRWRKGFEASIPAFAKVKKTFPSLRYVIVGKKHNEIMYKRIFDCIAMHNLRGSVHVLELVDSEEELRALYQNAELFLLLSRNAGHDVEGFGMVFLEAASQGLSVIGSRDCGVEDAMIDGKNGFLVHEKNIDEAAEATLRILQNGELKKRFSEESRKFAKNFLWDDKILEYECVYKRITSQSL